MGLPEGQDGIAIVRRLAVGGMSEVFLAEQRLASGDARPVVLKRLLPGASETARAALRREREALLALDSPFVVRCLGGSDDELVLEYVDGTDLAALLAHLARRGRTLPLPAALAVIEGVLLGLRDLHGARGPDGRPLGLVHRDLSPANVLLSRDGAVKLADLGVVHREVAGEPTLPGFKGTLAYMAPEQLRGEAVDPRTDLYAAGLIAYEVLTGVPARPAGLQGLAELLDARSRLPAPPSEVHPGLPRELDGPVLESLDPDRTRRFPSAVRMWEAFRAATGVAPDPSLLGAAVRGVGRPLLAVERTLQPDAPSRPAVPRQTSPRHGRARLVWPPVVLGVGVMVAWFAGWLRAPPAPSSVPGSSVTDAAALDDVSPGTVTTVEAKGSGEADRAVIRPPDLAPDVVLREPRHPRPPVPRRESRQGADERGGAMDVGTRGRRAGAIPVDLVVAPAGTGALHVLGGGARGLAPVRIPLAGSEAVVLTLHAGPSALPIVVRVQSDPEGPLAVVGAPEGRYYQVSCGGTEPRPSPVGPIRVGARLRCEVAAPDGASAAFDLRVESR